MGTALFVLSFHFAKAKLVYLSQILGMRDSEDLHFGAFFGGGEVFSAHSKVRFAEGKKMASTFVWSLFVILTNFFSVEVGGIFYRKVDWPNRIN